MDSLLGDSSDCFPLLLRWTCRCFRLHRRHGSELLSGTANQTGYPELEYRCGCPGGMELHSRRSFFLETALAVGVGFHPFGFPGGVSEVAESPTPSVFGMCSLGFRAPIYDPPQGGDRISRAKTILPFGHGGGLGFIGGNDRHGWRNLFDPLDDMAEVGPHQNRGGRFGGFYSAEFDIGIGGLCYIGSFFS